MNDDQFLQKTPMKPSTEFTQNLLNQLHALDEKEQDNMTVYTPTLNPPIHRTRPQHNQTGVVLGLIASIAILFFGISWLNNHHNSITSEPLQVTPPQPEFIQRIGGYGTFITGAFDEENNRATILSTTGIYHLPLDDFSAPPQLIRPVPLNTLYDSFNRMLHIAQGETMIAVHVNQTIEAINIQTGETISTWNPLQVVSSPYASNYFSHQLTNDGTRYHMALCLTPSCSQQTIATWDTTTGELIRTVEAPSPFTYTQDGETLFYTRSQTQVIRHEIATGEETEFLTSTDEIVDLAVSFDEAQIAVLSEREHAVELNLYNMDDLSEPVYNHKAVINSDVIQRQRRVLFSTNRQSLLVYGLGQTNYRLELTNKQINYINLGDIVRLSEIIPNESQSASLNFVSINQRLEARSMINNPFVLGQSDYFSGNSSLISFQAFTDGIVWRSQGSAGRDLWRWEWQDGQLIPVEEQMPSIAIYGGILYSDDMKYLTFTDLNNRLYIYDRVQDEITFNPNERQANSRPSYKLSFDAQNRLYAQYYDGTIDIYDPIEGLIGSIAETASDKISTQDTFSPDFSAIARISDQGEYGNSNYQWEIIFLDELNVVGTLIISNPVLISPLNLPTVTFSADGTEALIASFCPTDDPCTDMRNNNTLPQEGLIYRLALTEFREQLLDMADLPLEERVIEYEITEPITHSLDSILQIAYRPNTDQQIAVQTKNSVVVLQLDGQEATLLHTLPSISLLSGIYFTFSPDGEILYVNQDGFMDVWRLPNVE
jgi:hypothetical protein